MNDTRSRYLARYLDGVTSQPRDVTLSITNDSLTLLIDGISLATWPYCNVYVKEDWVGPIGGTLGYRENPDASLVIYNERQFIDIQTRLSRKHKASFVIPAQYRYLLLMGVAAVAAAYILFPVVSHVASWITYLVPQSVENRLGQIVVDEMGDDFGACDDKDALASLQKITKRLSLATIEKNNDPDIYIFISSEPNAFSLPGQKIAVLSAFLNEARSENEIAAVIAHEMGHMIKRDALEAFIQSQGIGIIVGLMSSSGSYGGVAEFVSFMENMSYSRQKEFRADEYGVELLLRAGYSPDGLSSFLSRMDKMDNGMMGEVIKHAEFLSTHPNTEERVKRIKAFGSSHAYKPSLSVEEFKGLKNACRSIPSKALKSKAPLPLPKSEGSQE